MKSQETDDLEATGPKAAYTNHILGVVNSLFSAGAGFGALSMGWLADIIGRKRSLILATTISLVGGVCIHPFTCGPARKSLI
jgi:MFS family permease